MADIGSATTSRASGRLGGVTALATSGLLALTLLQVAPASAEEVNQPPVANSDVAEEVNQPPIAKPDAAKAQAGGKVRVNPLTNDEDPEGGPLTLTGAVVKTPKAGTVEINGDFLVIRPAQSFSGNMVVTYTVADALDAVGQGAVTVVVTKPPPPPPPPPPPNKRPVAVRDTAKVKAGKTITVKVLANDRDRDGDRIRLVRVKKARAGKARKVGARVRYTAPASFSGKVRITYKIRDSHWATDKGILKVTVKRPAVPTRRAVEAALARLKLPGGVVNGTYEARTRRALCTWRTVTGRSAHRGYPSASEARALVRTKRLPKARSSMVAGVNVSRTCQAVFWVSNNRNFRRIMPGSTGMSGYATRRGTNRIFITHRTWRYSTIYPDARMYKPMQFDGGQAIHGSASDSLVKTYPASHGCVRMLHRDINALQAGGVGNGTWVRVFGAW